MKSTLFTKQILFHTLCTHFSIDSWYSCSVGFYMENAFMEQLLEFIDRLEDLVQFFGLKCILSGLEHTKSRTIYGEHNSQVEKWCSLTNRIFMKLFSSDMIVPPICLLLFCLFCHSFGMSWKFQRAFMYSHKVTQSHIFQDICTFAHAFAMLPYKTNVNFCIAIR